MMKPVCSSPSANFLRKAALAFSATTLLAIAALVVSGYAGFGAGWRGHLVATKTPVVASQSDITRDDLEAELITIFPRGFEPAEITRPPGRFLLVIDDRSGLDEIILGLERQGGQSVHGFRMTRNELELTKVVDLKPGVYILREARHADWTCQLTISGS